MSVARPVVTILVPTIGRREFFGDTVRSVAAQTLEDFEVIVLDNASPADARRAFQRWAESDTRVRIESVEPRIPMFSNFNRGIALARGEYVVFFHDDDVYLPELLTTAVANLNAHPRAAFWGSNYDFIDGEGTVVEPRRWIRQSACIAGTEYIRTLVRRGRNNVSMPGLVFRTDALREGFDESLSMHFGDFVLLMRLAERREVFLSSERHVLVRRHDGQASQSMPMSRAIPLRTETMLAYCDEYLERYPDETSFIRPLKRRTKILHRVGLAWGWVTAADAAEATACVSAMDARLDWPLPTILSMLDKPAIRTQLRDFVGQWRTFGKRLGTRLGV